jgi:2-polyprenyl-3-methyl-5-hydroxy-6-metoxy-1,4-benzoquinol methylase
MDTKKRNETYSTISDTKLKYYYKQGWETKWLNKIDKNSYPLDAGYKKRMERTFDALEISKNDYLHVLDLGCGIGIYSINLVKRFPNINVIGVDISKKQIEVASNLVKVNGYEGRCKFQVGDIGNISFSSPFDIVICTEVLEHFPKPKLVLEKIISFGNNKTRFIFSVPQFYHKQKQSGIFYKQILKDGSEIHTQKVENLSNEVEVYSYFHALYTVDNLKQLLDEFGMQIKSIYGSEVTIPILPISHKNLLGTLSIKKRNLFAKSFNTLSDYFPLWLDNFICNLINLKFSSTIIVKCIKQ